MRRYESVLRRAQMRKRTSIIAFCTYEILMKWKIPHSNRERYTQQLATHKVFIHILTHHHHHHIVWHIQFLDSYSVFICDVHFFCCCCCSDRFSIVFFLLVRLQICCYFLNYALLVILFLLFEIAFADTHTHTTVCQTVNNIAHSKNTLLIACINKY